MYLKQVHEVAKIIHVDPLPIIIDSSKCNTVIAYLRTAGTNVTTYMEEKKG